MDDGSIFQDGEPTNTKYYIQTDGSKAATSDVTSTITTLHNGSETSQHIDPGDAGKTLMRLTFVTDVKKYVILPPIKITAN